MDNKEQDQLWDDNTDYKPLRRPNSNSAVETKVRHSNQEDKVLDSSISTIESATNNEDISNISNSLNDMVVNSKLRVEAKEWFPSTYSPTAPQLAQPAQSRLQRIKSGNSITMNEYNPETSQHRMEFDTVNLDLIIQSLIYDPGQFDNLVDNFIAILEPHFEDLEVAIRTAETIFEFALREPSFRYNAARLCSVLDEHYPLFRPRLHMLCEAELNTDIPNQGFTLFLAELYMQLHYQAVYGRCILDSLKKLVVSDEPDNIKSACQALKLAGYSLESNNSNALDEIFQDLEVVKLHLQQPLFTLVESVITLRKNNWGRSTNTAVSTNSSQEQNGVVTSSSDEEFVLYGPDGQEMTAEEQEFFYSNFGDDGEYLGDESSDPDDLYNPEPEMDKEIQEAFREFVKLSKR
ncbi:hypothetical protein QE152_g6535 [Popillia japonica]|uniref:MIF4G domain-containing protein n=1 Tax=Popillia japonica TaxID=7064 RepID=A0AAW1MIH5_POPJA